MPLAQAGVNHQLIQGEMSPQSLKTRLVSDAYAQAHSVVTRYLSLLRLGDKTLTLNQLTVQSNLALSLRWKQNTIA